MTGCSTQSLHVSVCLADHARAPCSRMKRAQSTPHAMTALRQASVEPFGSLHGANGYGAFLEQQKLKNRYSSPPQRASMLCRLTAAESCLESFTCKHPGASRRAPCHSLLGV